jgi:ATP adenylyltransferase
MKRLWAPWRLEYIKQIRRPSKGCFLCEALRGRNDRSSGILARGASAFCILNKYPYTNGHLMVAPNAHKADLKELNPKELSEMMKLARQAGIALREKFNAEGLNLGMNLGKAAGAGLETHLHLHIVPRWHGDTNFMPVMTDTRVISQGLEQAWELLAPGFRRKS